MDHQYFTLDKLHISESNHFKLNQYYEMLIKWEKKTDLIGSSDHKEFFKRHIYNSLSLLNILGNNDKSIFDIGSGSGLPGIVCRICDSNDNRFYSLYEKKYQKRSFLKNVIIKLGLKNIEVLGDFNVDKHKKCDVLVSRALLSLKDLIDYKSNFKKFILFKGINYKSEIEGLQNKNIVNNIKIYKIFNSDSYLIAGVSDECFT